MLDKLITLACDAHFLAELAAAALVIMLYSLGLVWMILKIGRN